MAICIFVRDSEMLAIANPNPAVCGYCASPPDIFLIFVEICRVRCFSAVSLHFSHL